MSQGNFETYQRSTQTAAEETRQRLSERAFKLLEASMMPNTPTHKHKWATGREKWEAVQEAGRYAATGRGRGRPRKEVNWAERLQAFMTELTSYQRVVMGLDECSFPPEVLQIRLRAQLTNLEANGVLTEEVAMATRLLIG